MGENGEREKKNACVAVKRGVRVRRNCNIFNLAMENVLKGLPDKISCPDIIHKCTSNVHIFLITFKLRDTGTCFIQKIYAPSSSGRGRGGGI